MQAKELKAYLLEDTDRICKLLEHFNFHSVWFATSEEIRCATPEGANKTAVSVKLTEELFATSFDDKFNFRGDILGLVEKSSDTSFSNIMITIHKLFNIEHTGKVKKKLDLLKDVRKYKKGNKKDVEIKKYDKSILNQFVKKPHASMIEEAISPLVLEKYEIMFDIKRDRIIFPHFDIDEPDKVVGIQGRTTLSSELAKELGIPKYWNIISGFKKSHNLYGWHLAKDNIKKNKMLILFEGEKSVLKHATMCFGEGYSVALGGHEITEFQKNFIIKNTSEDVEIVIAFDKDIMKNQAQTEKDNIDNGTSNIGELEQACQMFSKYRKTSYIFDKYGVLGEKDSPVDKGYAKFNHLLKWRVTI